ncbi:hypothetical protein EYC84_005304 [Monilinia fructicola]|uniref:Uncharacterized protein n=1 Tax=Monilinia fructicola TaxID=38448 RepID=A0A5M9JW33_MONFR|nr:hypothetical protein EYC84_005304 [Monilinia fructicola]
MNMGMTASIWFIFRIRARAEEVFPLNVAMWHGQGLRQSQRSAASLNPNGRDGDWKEPWVLYIGINESCRQWKIESVAHAVTISSDKPMILEAEARARQVEIFSA